MYIIHFLCQHKRLTFSTALRWSAFLVIQREEKQSQNIDVKDENTPYMTFWLWKNLSTICFNLCLTIILKWYFWPQAPCSIFQHCLVNSEPNSSSWCIFKYFTRLEYFKSKNPCHLLFLPSDFLVRLLFLFIFSLLTFYLNLKNKTKPGNQLGPWSINSAYVCQDLQSVSVQTVTYK